MERWVKSWARVRCVKGDRRLLDVARAFANKDIIRLLEDSEQVNEVVCVTFACDLTRIVEALALGGGLVLCCSLVTGKTLKPGFHYPS